MPRIDPVQLLNCLSVLLSQNGGIKSGDEVPRLARLMTRFSRKLVSKCIYIQILKCTETELLRLFMGAGGWQLVHMWLMESIVGCNWPLVRELLELLLLCPVDIERLKTNNCPKLVKELSKDGNHLAIRALASKLVEQWLKTVKGEITAPIQIHEISQIITEAQSEISNIVIKNEDVEIVDPKNIKIEGVSHNTVTQSNDLELKNINESKEETSQEHCDNDTSKGLSEEIDKSTDVLPVLKIKVKDGKQILTKVEDSISSKSEDPAESSKTKDKHKDKSKDKSREKSGSSSKSSSKHSSRSSSDKHKSKSSSKDSKDKHSSSSRDKSKDKYSSSSSSKSKNDSRKSEKSISSSSKHKEEHKNEKKHDKDKVKDKTDKKDDKSDKKDDKSEKETIPPKVQEEIPQSPSIHKLGKIPRLSDVKKDKPSISIEVRKPDEPKPKTVKTFNSKFRKHGLEDEIKPPPSRAAVLSKKVPPVLPPTIPIPKRASPIHNHESPPEKKPKTVESPVEKPGSIKLIAPKAKPMLLLESDMFMDALNASATNKKEPKKRKRRTSGSKDGNSTNDGSPPHTPSVLTSPTSESKSVPPRFYQDTLESDENKEKLNENTDNSMEDSIIEEKVTEKMDTIVPHTLTINGLKGVLCYHKKKGPKKSIKWKPDCDLEEVQYFELDETERVNVTKPFMDMKHLERINEREAFQKARNLSVDDVMEEKTSWRQLILIDAEGQIQVEYGKNSKEKDIQAARQKGTLQPLYFHKSMIPDSPFEPDLETHLYSEPTIIPLDDVTGNQDNISDFRNMPWPEPKGDAPPPTSTINVPNMFTPNMPQFPNGFPPAQFPGVPGYQPPMVPTDWPNGVPPMLPNGMGAPMAPGGFVPGPMPPGMMPPDGNLMMGPGPGPEMFAPNGMFPMPDGFNMQQNMFPMDFNMGGPQGPPGPDAFQGQQNYRGPPRGRGGGHWRGKVAGSWDGNQRGRGGGPSRGGAGRKNLCIYFQRKGSCRQGDKCTFLHPGVNCPY